MIDGAHKGHAMVIDLINSCAHGAVARAALVSIGPAFHDRVRAAARHSGTCDEGAFAATSVRSFAREAGEAELRHLARVMAGKDQPVLEGLRFIMDRAISRHAERGVRAGVFQDSERRCARA